jgi:hypothetical protein
VNKYNPKHAKPAPPFRETAAFKFVALTAVTPVAAGLVATGGAVATYTLADRHTPPGVYYGVAVTDHTDPNHVDPGGEWIRIEAAPTIGTAAVNHVVLGPGD